MESNSGYSSIIYLQKSLTQLQRRECFRILSDNGFIGYDFKTGSGISIEELLDKYPNRQQYSTTYKNNSFGISCAEGNDFIITRMDHRESSGMIVKISDALSVVATDVRFAYIDSEGDPPKNIEKLISSQTILWFFKYNYFGKNYIDKFGREFFDNFPCENKEYMTDEIIRIDLFTDLSSPVSNAMKEKVVQYCSGHSLSVKFYNPKNFMID